MIDEYLTDGYRWFVFDVVELTSEPRTNDAIEYRFACDKLYYPLRITRVEQGETDIRLIVLTEKLLSEFPALPASLVKLAHSPVTISGEELRELSPAMHTLLGEKKEQKLRVWRIHGKLDEFKHDLLAE